MYPYKIRLINKNQLIEEIIFSTDGEKIFINEATYITVHKIKKEQTPDKQEPIPATPSPIRLETPKEEPLENNVVKPTPVKNDDDNSVRHCDNPHCSWKDETFFMADMTEYGDKLFCTLDCAQQFMRNGKKETFDLGSLKKDQPKQKQWSRKYDRCTKCRTTEKKYFAAGMCTTCYFRVKK